MGPSAHERRGRPRGPDQGAQRSLKDQARTSELGAGQSSSGGAYVPPPAPAYNAPDYTAPTYGAPPPYGTQYPAPYPAPRRNVSGGIPWLVFGLSRSSWWPSPRASSSSPRGWRASRLQMVRACRAAADRSTSRGTRRSTFRASRAPPGAPGADPDVISPPPGGEVSVSGVENNKTVACNDGSVNISGIRNTVNIIGHCVKVTVSGIEQRHHRRRRRRDRRLRLRQPDHLPFRLATDR